MPASYPGASGPNGNAGPQSAHGQRVSEIHAGQPSQERLVLDQIKKLTVRSLTDIFDSKINQLLDGARTLSKYPCSSTRYSRVPLKKRTPNRSVGLLRDKGKDRHFVGALG